MDPVTIQIVAELWQSLRPFERLKERRERKRMERSKDMDETTDNQETPINPQPDKPPLQSSTVRWLIGGALTALAHAFGIPADVLGDFSPHVVNIAESLVALFILWRAYHGRKNATQPLA